MSEPLTFNRLPALDRELEYVAQACDERLSGDGRFSRLCSSQLEQRTGTARALLTHSCTAALEMAALLLNIGPGDEVIMPSFTFVSTANAFALRGAVPVFIDIRDDTLNLDERLIESAITKKTRAIVPVHYAGIACEMDTVVSLADARGLAVVEDAAQGLGATYKGRALGALGTLGTLSFHETKNIVCGEGGALLVNRPDLIPRAEIIREKGTDRSRFQRGEVDKYTWQELGSSFLPSDIIAAFLLAQLEKADAINAARLHHWELYHERFADAERTGLLKRPTVPAGCIHNGHIYYVILPTSGLQEAARKALAAAGIQSVSHYVPLHSSPGGLRYGRTQGKLVNTEDLWSRVLRLPMGPRLPRHAEEQVVATILKVI